MAKLHKDFISDIDKFLQDFDKRYPKRSLTQENEIKNYARINQLRDFPISRENSTGVWEDF
jgi:hypothetical protein